MSNYDHTLSLTLPAAILPIAQSISRALDPDVGGVDSWTVDGENITTSTPCTEEFYNQAQYMITDPAALYDACAADYTKRWSELVPPSLEDCQLFCASIIM